MESRACPAHIGRRRDRVLTAARIRPPRLVPCGIIYRMSNSPKKAGQPSEAPPEQSRGILDARCLPDDGFTELWDAIYVDQAMKDRLLGQAILNFTLRPLIKPSVLPVHGIILLVGPPGTGKTSLARGLASRTAGAVKGIGEFRYLEVEPHGLASSALGKSQQAVTHLLGSVIADRAAYGPLIVLLDEVETLASDRTKMSLEANPIDVHRTTDAVLAQLDRLAVSHPRILFVATSNFPEAIDGAFLSRVDAIEKLDFPSAEACKKILSHTVGGLAEAFPTLKSIAQDPVFAKVAERCVGLDGRRIRKLVFSACSQNKEIAIDPKRLKASDILAAVERIRQELGLL